MSGPAEGGAVRWFQLREYRSERSNGESRSTERQNQGSKTGGERESGRPPRTSNGKGQGRYLQGITCNIGKTQTHLFDIKMSPGA